MRKIVIGLVALVLLAVGGYFGAVYWATQRAEAEVETTFAALRATGANASHGSVSFDLMSRTLVVADIAVVQAGSPSALTVRVGRMTAVGVGQPGAGRMSADRIELADLATESTVAALPGASATYKAPRIEILGYSGPAAPFATARGSSVFDQLRASIEQFATVTVSSMTIPSLTASVQPALPGKTPQFAGPITVDYSGFVLRDLRDRHVAVIAIDKCDIALPGMSGSGQGPSKLEFANIAMSDLAFGALLAAFDPAAANDDTYHRLYGQITTGTVKAAFEKAGGFVLDGVTVADVAFKPAKLRPDKLMAIADTVGVTPAPISPAQTRQLLEEVATVYEGVRIGKFELRGLAVVGPPGADPKLAAIRLEGLEDGRLAEFAIEGLEANTPSGPGKIGRFALLGVQIANTVRFAARGIPPNAIKPADQAVDALRLLEGVAIKNLDVPDKAGKRILVDTLNATWGQFVGPIPTKLRITLAMTGPIGTDDPGLAPLVAAGITSATVASDVQAEWTEASKTLSVTPLVLDVANMFSASATLSVENVPRDIFSTNPTTLTALSAGVEAGPVEFTLRDTGGLDLAIVLFAKQKGLSLADARKAVAAMASAFADQVVAQNGDLKPLADAVADFVGAPKATLRIKLSPKGRTAVMQIIADGRIDPFAALARFNIEATASR